MDQGVNLPFSSHGIDDATFGLPTFADGWKGLIITGSSQKALRNPQDGGRLILTVKCVHDPANVDNGKEHLIGLNIWHTDASTRDRAAAELATICRAVGVLQFNNTAELYNRPFMAKAVTQTPAATPQYPNPTPQTNWRGYATLNGEGVGIDGPNGRLGNAGGGAGPGAGAPPNFAQQGQPQQGQQPQQGGWNAPNPQGGTPQGGQGGWNQQNPNPNPNQQQGQQGGWNQPGNGGGANGQGQQGNPAGATQPNANPNQWGNGGGASSPSSPQGGWGQPQQGQGPQGGGAGNPGGGWGPQGGGNGPAPWGQ